MHDMDHDLLIRLSSQMTDLQQQINGVVKHLEKMDAKQDQSSCRQSGQVDKCNLTIQQKLDVKWFKWVITFIIAGILSMGAVTVENSASLKQIEQDLKIHKIYSERFILDKENP